MQTAPLIGITTYGRDATDHFALPGVYVDAVRRAGGIPVLIPAGEPLVRELLARLDGLILSGGGDLDPVHYNGQPHATIYLVDAERDRTELELVQRVAQSDLPTLGICRGAQVINVALGGTLIEHLPDEVNGEVEHRRAPPGPTEHPITIQPGSRLAEILGVPTLRSASWHHQAIRRPAEGLRVVAHAPDGTIEAAELTGHPWLVAVQWHPEMTAAADPTHQRIFDALVAAAKVKRLGD
jgi:putative glutamine amidotransferase